MSGRPSVAMSRSVRAETRQRGQAREDHLKRHSHAHTHSTMHVVERVRHWEKKWVTIGETTMKIFKWVPISSSEQKKKSSLKTDNKENAPLQKKGHDSSNSNFGLAEDSNTCFSTVSDSQGPMDFSSSHMAFSEDSNSQCSDPGIAAKRLKTE